MEKLNVLKTVIIPALALSLAACATPSSPRPQSHQAKARYRHMAHRQRPQQESASELGFALDPVNVNEWKKLREDLNQPEFTTLQDPPESRKRN